MLEDYQVGLVLKPLNFKVENMVVVMSLRIHSTNYWENTGTGQLSIPTLSITSIKWNRYVIKN